MTTLTATAVRQNFFKLLDNVEKKSERLVVTLNGLPKVVIIPYKEYEKWFEHKLRKK